MDREEPRLFSIAVLSSDRLVVGDFTNHSVKLFDVVQDKVLHQLEVGNWPTSVCSLPEARVAVTLPLENSILILHCDNTLSIVNTITVQGFCWSIAYSNKLLIVLYPRKIEIMNLNGSVIKQNELNVPDQFSWGSQLSVMTEGDITSIYVGDSNNKRILRLDENLQEQQIYRLPDGAKPYGVLVVGENQLLVRVSGGNLWQLDTTMGRWTLLSERFVVLESMAFCHERQVLYYGHFSDSVKRYAIS